MINVIGRALNTCSVSENSEFAARIVEMGKRCRSFLNITPDDVQALRAMAGRVAASADAIVSAAASSLLADPEGRECVQRSGLTLERAAELFKYWLAAVFGGDYGDRHAILVAKIGLAHVKSGVKEQLMVETMGAFARELAGLSSNTAEAVAVVKALYWNLSIMLYSYSIVREVVRKRAIGVDEKLYERLIQVFAKEVYGELSSALKEAEKQL